MKKYIYYIGIILVLSSCQNEYIIGGEGMSNNIVDMSTIDYLKSTKVTAQVAELFVEAGLTEEVNKKVTIFSPTDWSVNRFIRREKNIRQLENSESIVNKISIKEIPDMLIPDPDFPNDKDKRILGKELLKMYIFPNKIDISSIPSDGLFIKSIDGKQEVCVKVEIVNSDPLSMSTQPGKEFLYSDFMDGKVKILHVLFKRGQNWEMTFDERKNMLDNPECDQHYRMYISNVITNNGVVHVLYGDDSNELTRGFGHTLFFYGNKSND